MWEINLFTCKWFFWAGKAKQNLRLSWDKSLVDRLLLDRTSHYKSNHQKLILGRLLLFGMVCEFE